MQPQFSVWSPQTALSLDRARWALHAGTLVIGIFKVVRSRHNIIIAGQLFWFTPGISCTGCIHVYAARSDLFPKCTLQQPVAPKSKHQQDNESHSSKLVSLLLKHISVVAFHRTVQRPSTPVSIVPPDSPPPPTPYMCLYTILPSVCLSTSVISMYVTSLSFS